MNKQLTILSTYAQDKLVNNKDVIRTQLGGPALYLKNVFDTEGISFDAPEFPEMEVEILIKPDGEYGKVTNEVKPQASQFNLMTTPYLVISSILDEFDLSNIDSYKGKVFLDAQGYVRDGQNFGGKKMWVPSTNIAESIFCLKGTEEELMYLPTEFVESQKQKILIETRGAMGCRLFVFGKEYELLPKQVIQTQNTIGAGDTFFAYFIANSIKGIEPADSAFQAMASTSNFLHHTQSF